MNTAPADTSESPAIEDTAAAEREAIVAEADAFVWNEQPLQPWSAASESLLARLIALDVPAGDLDELPRIQQRLVELQAKDQSSEHLTLADVTEVVTYVPTAGKLLYLALVPRLEWFHLRGRPAALISAIEKWTEANIAPEQECDACMLAQRVRSAHTKILAMRRPQRSNGRHEGN